MDNRYQRSIRATGNRIWVALALYTAGGWVTLWLLLAARAESDLPEALDTGFVAVFVAGLLVTVLLIKTRIAGSGPPILQALRALAIVLVFAAMGLLVAHWIELGSATPHAHAVLRETTQGVDILPLPDACDSMQAPGAEDCP